MTAYADTSFLASLYIQDVNAESASLAMQKAEFPLSLSPLSELELENALAMRLFWKELSGSEIHEAIGQFRKDVSSGIYFFRPFPPAVYDRALKLIRKHTARAGVRSLDILHLAVALEMRAKIFYTFDKRQAKLALKEGLQVLP